MLRRSIALALVLVAGCSSAEEGGRDDERPKPPIDVSYAPPPPDPECGAARAGVDVPIVVDDGGNTVARSPAVTGFLIPFGADADVRSTTGLGVFDERGNAMLAQLEVLSRWGGHRADCARPIRFAYAHVASVPATGARAKWRVKSGAPPSQGGIRVSDDESAIVVDTGAARFTISRASFSGLSRVEIDGTIVSEGGGFFLDHGGRMRPGKPWLLYPERRGPVTASVVARGWYAPDGGGRDLAYTIRLHFHAGSAAVKVDHTYYHGAVGDWFATGGANTTRVERAFMQVPLRGKATAVSARADTEVHDLGAAERVEVRQENRTPDRVEQRYTVTRGTGERETGALAVRPYVGAANGEAWALATIARMSVREPQGVAFDPAANALEVAFTSEPITVGGARGIWSTAAIAFGKGAASFAARADPLLALAERPLLGAPDPAWTNATRTIGPYLTEQAAPRFEAWTTLMDDLFTRTKSYLADYRITGIQIWPDLPRDACVTTGDCSAAESTYFEGGDDNYWNWSKAGIDELFRTGKNDRLYAFSLGEAITFVETLAFRTDHDRNDDSSVTGLAPCYGSGRGYSDEWIEGLNNRRDACPADYSYNKTLALAYLATADRRFTDYFEEAAVNAVARFGLPASDPPEEYLELGLARLSEQRLETVLNGAEFVLDPEVGGKLRGALSAYVDRMLGTVLIDGHSCDVLGTARASAREIGRCTSQQAWMMPVAVAWARRTAAFLGHERLAAWVLEYGKQAAKHHTVLGANGLPDYEARDASSSDDAANGWRTVYGCALSGASIDEGSCRKATDVEAMGYFYPDGIMAFLNVFGLVLGADARDPDRVCAWLPGVYLRHLGSMNDLDTNGRVWGKISGQAFAFSPEAVGALAECR